MAKLILEMQTSLDGYMAGLKGETDWMVWNWGPQWTWDKELQDFHTDLTLSASHLLLSKQMAAEGFIAHWRQTAARKDEQTIFASHISQTPKTVISTTLSKEHAIPGGWDGVALSGNLATTVTKLKQEHVGNILVYGGATLVSSLLKHELIDELYLLVNPVAIGKGLTIYHNLKRFQLKKARSFPSGVAVLHYIV